MKASRRSRKWIVLSGVILLLFAMVLFGIFFAEEPVRRYVEAKMNRALVGYTVTLEGLDLRPVITMHFENLRIFQDAQPDRPVAFFPEIRASIHWRALVAGRLVGDMILREPEIYLDLEKIEQESKDEVPVEERGWQHALSEMYPFKINRLEIEQGKIEYAEKDDPRRLEMSEVNMVAENIRNVLSPGNVYPSEMVLRARVFEQGLLEVDGQADFLREPHVGVKGSVTMKNLDIGKFQTILKHSPVAVKSGILESMEASMEYAPGNKWIHVHSATLKGLDGRYIHPQRGEEEVKKAAREIAEEKKEEDELQIMVELMHIEKSTLGFENAATEPSYQVFVKDMQARIENYSNGFRKGDALIRLRGKFMGSGPLVLTGTFRPEDKGADFNLNLVIEDTAMPDMNNLFRAYGNFDTEAGWFSLYSEIKVQNGRIEGYVKPLFRQVEIHGDEGDGFFSQIWEGILDAIVKLLQTGPRKELGTRADISGTLENPETDTLQALITLVQNAFFDVIVPGLENEL